MRIRAKLGTDRTIRCGDMDIILFFKIATVSHLGFQKFNILAFSTIRVWGGGQYAYSW